MADFDRALDVVLLFEGGYVDDPDDPGGATNHGITQAVYDAWRTGLGVVTQSVERIAPDEVEGIYRRNYWEPLSCGYMEWPLNLFIFDAAVLHGPERARTMIASVQFSDKPLEYELHSVLAIRRYLFRRDATTSPKKAKFLAGWDARIEKLRQLAGL